MSLKHTLMERLSTLVGTRYGALLLVLLLQLGLFSFLDQYGAIRWILDLSILALVGSVLHAVSGRPWLRVFVIVVGVASMLLSATSRELGVGFAFSGGALSRALLFGVVIGVIFGDILKRREVDMDAVFGACCVYLLMGLAWESIYTWVEWGIPGSFALPEGMPETEGIRGTATTRADLIYFSLITMTTIGYGDIAPKSPPARIFAALQGLLAQLYLAIIIARMVGMELASRRSGASRKR